MVKYNYRLLVEKAQNFFNEHLAPSLILILLVRVPLIMIFWNLFADALGVANIGYIHALALRLTIRNLISPNTF